MLDAFVPDDWARWAALSDHVPGRRRGCGLVRRRSAGGQCEEVVAVVAELLERLADVVERAVGLLLAGRPLYTPGFQRRHSSLSELTSMLR